jgi:hypothetical protein
MSLRRIKTYLYYYSGSAEYLFIHIPKNAGVAIRHSPLLERRLVGAEPAFHISRDYTRRLLQTMKATGEHHGYQHARLRDIHPSVRQRLQPVAVVRNPWSRVVSRFTFSQLAMKNRRALPDYSARDFEAFLEERHIYGNKEFYWHRAVRGWFNQKEYVIDEEGKIAVDLLRHERLDEDAMAYFSLDRPLRKRNISNRTNRDYRDYYDRRTLQIVADWYADDIDTFGFDFEGCATRNVRYV